MMALQLTELEQQNLEAALAKISFRLGRKIHLGKLVSRWSQFVDDIERGYRLSVYDYTNEMSVRDLLKEVCEMTNPSLSTKIGESLASLDKRFRDSTDEVVKPLLQRDGSWWRRIPRKRDPDFDESLNSGNRLIR